MTAGNTVRALFDHLLGAYGPRHWWPARTVPAMMAGAVLVQNTAWIGAARAVERLEGAGLLEAWFRLLAAPDAEVEELIRPAGYFRLKTRRLKALAAFMVDSGGDHRLLFARETEPLRRALLGVWGVGEETADSILCYAAHRPVFVVDAYTRRIFSRLGWIDPALPVGELQRFVGARFPAETPLLGEFHALLVEHAKRHCRARPLCDGCPVVFCPRPTRIAA